MSRRKPLVLAGYALASAVRPLIGLAQSAAQVLGDPGHRPRRQGAPHLPAGRADRRFGRPRHPRPGLRLPQRRRQRWGPCWGRSSPSPSCAGSGLAAAHRLPADRHPRRPGGADAAPRGARGAADGAAEAGGGGPTSRRRSAGGSGPISASSCCSPWATRPTPSCCCGPASSGSPPASSRSSGRCSTWSRSALQHARGDPLGPPRAQAAHRRRLAGLRRRLFPLRPRRAGLAGLGAVRRLRPLLRPDRGGGEGAGGRPRARQDRRGAAFGWYNLAIGVGGPARLAPLRRPLGPLGIGRRLRLRRPARPGGGGRGDARGAATTLGRLIT